MQFSADGVIHEATSNMAVSAVIARDGVLARTIRDRAPRADALERCEGSETDGRSINCCSSETWRPSDEGGEKLIRSPALRFQSL